ncbi:LINE-1 reverse transcriptase isogeny [Gossypium australe]|uniref:LINE-1 reverse transcriptase isogeny n=1 Tax=Gossypium australe TaxID=47621 RepID=A0A5B6X7Y9_9ROSI|nr:LINE-1 reverse transcriptase isogeny [Gossypium australe]
MEWLGHSINSALLRGIWNPIHDLAIFCKADAKHGKLLKEILHDFCELSGDKVNPMKTNIFFSKGVGELAHDLGHYLGVPLFHQRVTNNTMCFVMEKVRMKLQSWDARQLSIVGRATLAQSVLLSIPGYFMQSIMNPKKICNEIERLARTFIWGTTDSRKKMSLVG